MAHNCREGRSPRPRRAVKVLNMIVFTTRAALAAGMSEKTLRGRRFTAPLRGVRARADSPAEPLDPFRAVAAILHDDVAFSHVSALRIQGVEVPWRMDIDSRIHVVSWDRARRPRRPGIIAHGGGRASVTRVDGLLVTTPAQTWLHCSRSLSLNDLVVLGDAMLRRKNPATSLPALRRIAEETSKTHGVVQARAALALLRPGTDSSMETRTRTILVNAGLPCPAVNVNALDQHGRFLALPDMSYPELRIAIEYDGDIHRTDQRTWRRDVERRQRLEDAGWRIITVTADDVRDPARLIDRVRAAIHSRRAMP